MGVKGDHSWLCKKAQRVCKDACATYFQIHRFGIFPAPYGQYVYMGEMFIAPQERNVYRGGMFVAPERININYVLKYVF